MDFTAFPRGVLLMMLEYLDPKNVIAICSVNTEMKSRCDHIMAQLETLKRTAPLAKPTYTATEQLHLIDRGFVTNYYGHIDEDRSPVKNIQY